VAFAFVLCFLQLRFAVMVLFFWLWKGFSKSQFNQHFTVERGGQNIKGFL
jgi:hypothetical protein